MRRYWLSDAQLVQLARDAREREVAKLGLRREVRVGSALVRNMGTTYLCASLVLDGNPWGMAEYRLDTLCSAITAPKGA